MLLVEKCRERRAELGISIAKIAELSNIPLSTVNAFFSGTVKNPSLMTAGLICTVLGVSLDGLFGIENPDMGQEEIERIRAEYEESKGELQQKIEEHKNNILLHEVNLTNYREITRRQDLRIEGLEDRIAYQKKAITIHRIALATFLLSTIALLVYAISI